MIEFAIAAVIVGATVVLAERRFKSDTRNPVLVRCAACKAPMKRTVPLGTWWSFLSFFCMQIAFWFLIWRLDPPGLTGFLLYALAVFPVCAIRDHIYHAIWRWRHPTRCQGGGHPKLAPQGGQA